MERRDLVSYTEETQAVADGFSRRGTPHRRFLVRVALATLFLLSTFPLGIFWFIVLATLLLVGLPLTIVWVGLPILAMLLCLLGAGTERWRLAALLGTRLPSPYRGLPRGSILAHVRVRAADPVLWRALQFVKRIRSRHPGYPTDGWVGYSSRSAWWSERRPCSWGL